MKQQCQISRKPFEKIFLTMRYKYLYGGIIVVTFWYWLPLIWSQKPHSKELTPSRIALVESINLLGTAEYFDDSTAAASKENFTTEQVC